MSQAKGLAATSLAAKQADLRDIGRLHEAFQVISPH